MNKVFAFIPTLLISLFTYSQELSHVSFSGGTSLSSFSFRTEDGLIIRISEDGKLLEWGMEMEKWRYNYYPGKLLPYIGRVDYYGQEYDSVLRGKVRAIGGYSLTYYGPSEKESKMGKLRTIGRVLLDYYDNFDNQALRGKLRWAGSLSFNYYTSYDDEAFRGKLRSVGSNSITWYSTFDDRLIRGKLKSIGPVSFTWYTSHDPSGYQGGLKTGNLVQNVNGVTYIIM